MHQLVLLVLSVSVLAAAAPLPLMPLPAKYTPGDGRLRLTPDFAITIEGHADDTLRAAVSRLRRRLFRQTLLPLLPDAAGKPALTINCRAAAPAYPKLGEDESYTLDVTPDGARLTARTVTGALRGMATF